MAQCIPTSLFTASDEYNNAGPSFKTTVHSVSPGVSRAFQAQMRLARTSSRSAHLIGSWTFSIKLPLQLPNLTREISVRLMRIAEHLHQPRIILTRHTPRMRRLRDEGHA